MNPALSVIFFTTFSGAGFGVLIWIGLAAALAHDGALPPSAAPASALGLVLAVAGLLSSTAHLGRPERAWRAFSQWRTSWLSREGVAALLCLASASALSLLLMLKRDDMPNAMRVLGASTLLLSLATVFCTARIYTCLKTIAAWHNAYVLPGYLLLSLWSGALLLWLIGTWMGLATPTASLALTGALTGAALVLKLAYWRHIDRDTSGPTMGTATGLAHLGRVRAFEAPHTEDNYLLREMGFRLARKHGARLRLFTVLALVVVGLVLLLAALAPQWDRFAAVGALAFAALALFIERWLFFAQARHLVTLYYGGARA